MTGGIKPRFLTRKSASMDHAIGFRRLAVTHFATSLFPLQGEL
jgi:hypothetical protein